MTINPLVPRLLWMGTGATASISLTVDGEPITFRSSDHIVVRQRVMATGAVSILRRGVDYDISGGPVLSSDATPGTLTRIGGNLPSGYIWAILRATPIAQEIAIQPGGAFSSADIEAMGDRAAEASQDIAETVSRALVLSPFAVGVKPELPEPQAGALLAWNAGATGLENKAVGAIGAASFPVASADNAIVRFDGTSGRSLKSSLAILTDDDDISGLRHVSQTGFHDLTEMIAAPASPPANIARVYAVGDGAGITTLAMKDSAGNIASLSHFLQAGPGAVARSFVNKNRWRIDPEDFGDVSTDAVGCINRAVDYVNSVGGGEVRFDARDYSLAGAVVLKSGVRLVGKGQGNTRLKLATNANSAVIKTFDFDTLVSGTTEGGPFDWAIVGLTIDGNRANQNAGDPDPLNGVSAYGYRFLVEDILIRDVKGHGWRSKWGQFGEFAMEATVRRLRIDTCGRHGMRWAGPHDSYGEDIIIIDSGQETDNAFDGFLLEGFGQGKWVDVHPWHRSTAINRMAASARVETGGNEFLACNFEGGRQCLRQKGERNSYRNCYIYGVFSSAPMAVIGGAHLFFEARIEDTVPSGAPCLQIGGVSGSFDAGPLFHSHLNVMAITAATNAVVVSNDTGRNTGIIKTIGTANAYTGSFSANSPIAVQHPNATYEQRAALDIPKMAAPATPATGRALLYPKSDGRFYEKDDTGAERGLSPVGKQTRWITAAEMVGGATTLANIDFGGGLTLPVRQFDPATAEFAFFGIALPKSWNEGTISAQFYWAHPATTVNFGVAWSLGAGSFGDNDPLTNVYANTTIIDTGGTTSNLYISAETAALNPGNTEVENDILAMYVSRVATDGADTLAVDAYLIGIKLFYTTNAPNDA